MLKAFTDFTKGFQIQFVLGITHLPTERTVSLQSYR